MDLIVGTSLDTLSFTLGLLLVALGLVIIFGLMNVINMAHGELFLAGAYTVVLVERAGAPFWLGLALAPLAVGGLGLLLEELVVRHVYRRFLDTIIATWGVSIALKQLVVILFGPASHTVTTPIAGTVSLFGQPYPLYRLFIMAVAVLVILLTFFLFYRTNFGLSARGAIANRPMAACLGINTRRLDRLTFGYGAALAGLAGAVMAPIMSVDPQMGLGFLVPAFLSILVGGTGHLAAPLLGAVLVGGTDSLAASLWSPVAAQIVVFAMAIVVIRLFPRGLGERWVRR
jgi:branched-chain amino acid transport system permease protein/urea transport system permease protein